MFGHFEKPLFIELCKHIETKFLPANTVLSSEGVVGILAYITENLVSILIKKWSQLRPLIFIARGNDMIMLYYLHSRSRLTAVFT